MSLAYVIVDVSTDTPLRGNQLAVGVQKLSDTAPPNPSPLHIEDHP
jgi:predicted PhzF superfamily epimerase YddE/YHI9